MSRPAAPASPAATEPEVAGQAGGPLDEYYERYRAMAPYLLHTMLKAGDPDHVERVASSWHTAASSLGTIASAMRQGLLQVRPAWEGVQYHDFETRLLPIIEKVENLAMRAAKMQSGLTMMSAMLASAQREAEAPASPDDGGDIAGVVGAAYGRFVPLPQQSRMAARLAELVADLAVKYVLVEQKVWHAPLPAFQPLPAPAAPADQGGELSADAGPVSTLVGAPAATPPPDSTHLVGPAPGGTGSGAMVGGFPTVPMAAAVGGAGTDSSGGHRRGWTSAETAWAAQERPAWSDNTTAQQPHPIVGDRDVE
jgi:hypothetical protein